MRTLIAVLTLVTTMAVCPKLNAADETNGAAGENVREFVVQRIQDLNLTDQQEAKIDEIRKEFHPKIDDAAKELAGAVKDELTRVRAVFTPEQQQFLQTLRDERQDRGAQSLAERLAHLDELNLTNAEMAKIDDIRREFRPRIAQALQEMRGLLTDQQRQAREEAFKAGKSLRDIVQSLNLTDAQKEKMQQIGKQVAGVVGDELQQIRAALTPEQQELLQTMRQERQDRRVDTMAERIANLKELNLTDAQKAAIEDIRKEARPKIQESANKLRAAVRDEVSQIVAVIRPEAERETRVPAGAGATR